MNPNPNHPMTSQNPNSSPSLSLLNHLSNASAMYDPQQHQQVYYNNNNNNNNPRLNLNPNASEYYHHVINNGSGAVMNDQTLAAAFNRLNLFPEPPPPPSPAAAAGHGFGAIARPCMSSGHNLYPPNININPHEQEQYYLQHLHNLYKKRIESAVKGHQYPYFNHDLDLLGGVSSPLLNPNGTRKYNSNGGGVRRGRSSGNNRSSFEGSSVLASSSSSSSPSIYNRWKPPSYSSLEELKGRIGFAAKEQQGCVFLQEKIKDGDRVEIEFIFSEIVDCLHDLIVDQFGNSLVQKLFEVCDEAQITKILCSPAMSNEKRLMAICTNDHGTRVVQKLLEFITTMEQKSLIVSSLTRIGLPLMKDQKGHHVIQQCLRLFSLGDTKCLLHQVAENCLELALDRQGCCVLQLCLSQARGEYLDRLLAEIASNSLALSVNCFGNYVLQFVLELDIPQATAGIVSQLFGNYVTLSMNKCASNVVEKCLQSSDEDQCSMIVHELLSSPSFLNVCQDSYGNYVVQTALRVSKGDVHKCLANHIVKMLYPFLQSHPHGKNVLQEAKPTKNRGFNKKRYGSVRPESLI